MTGLSDELNRLNTEGWSTREIERVAERHGHKLHYSTVSNYMSGRHAAPTGRVLEAFAAVFGVDVNHLRTSAGMPSVGEPLDLGPESSRLTGPQREAIRTTVRLFVEQNDALASHAQRDGATTRTSGPGLRLLSDDVPDLRDQPYAADREEPGDDPGEDDD